jgi:hypothetical protein
MSRQNNKIGKGMHFEQLTKKEQEPINPLVPIIESMFSHELHETSWRKYTVEKTIQLLQKQMESTGIELTERHYLLLKKQLNKCKNMEACLQVLTNTILGQMEV